MTRRRRDHERVAKQPPPTDLAAERIRATAARLAGELDSLRLYQSAAFVAMAVDAMDRSLPAANDNGPRSDVECGFELDEHGRVWIILEGDCRIIGRKEAVRKEMWRFLRVLLPGLG